MKKLHLYFGLGIFVSVLLSSRGAESLPVDPPPGTKIVLDVAYAGTTHPRQKLDLFIPPDAKAPMPVVLSLHGGSWLRGDRKMTRAAYLLRKGMALASLDYRYSSDAVFPAQIQDVNAGLAWLWEHAAEYGLDRSRMVVTGSSAGGTLAILAGVAAKEKTFGADPRVHVRAVIDLFGPSDLTGMWAFKEQRPPAKSNEDSLALLLGAPVMERPDLARRASPVLYVDRDAPPFLIVHGDADVEVPVTQSRLLQAWLKQSGVRADLMLVSGAGHGGAVFQQQAVQERVKAFLTEVLK